ncbi:hypothetical protein TSAR_011248 [Trichomalopsis sarcophagae]|uniref:LisH domain-containing protein ARMC9 n=1 Tax=Trichomalopsis sarcophagae TaxID=543379 RepID=A0A232F3Y9_9HYME|nr:hypothetical protein TSAR_011248 [Trichomalopsis sarcophagae]
MEMPRGSRPVEEANEEEEADPLLVKRSLDNELKSSQITNNNANNVVNDSFEVHNKDIWKVEILLQIWDVSFISEIKESVEYKILTLKLRVHFAILPVRIVQLHQTKSDRSHKVTTILNNVSDKFSSVDDEKEIDDRAKLTVDSMKQLEDFLNSHDGQKLILELKDNSFMAFFALPYIVNPQEDESVKKIFRIEWLEELTTDLETFMSRTFFKEQCIKEQIETTNDQNFFPSMYAHHIIDTNRKSKLTKNNSQVLLCDRIIQSAIKNKQIEDWIAQHQHVTGESNLCSKGTQTRISSIKTGTGFSLTSELHHYVSVVIPNNCAVPSKQSALHNDELNTTKSRLLNVHKHYRKLKLRFHKLHEDYQKMNEIAEELTIALESSVKGQPVNLDMILQSCMKIFPDRFSNRDIQTDSEDTCVDSKEETSKNVPAIEEQSIHLNNTPVPPKLLDYKKIKLHLKSIDMKTKLLLLQALRRKLTRSQQQHRDQTIHEYRNKDLLGIQEIMSNVNSKNILFNILPPINADISMSLIQQTSSRFLNTIASLSAGRTYLAQGPIVLNAIIKYLDSCNDGSGDAVTLDMLLATLQKMSLRKQQRNYMVKANLVEWLIHHLHNENCRMGAYRLEYTCALLMNLSLQSAARSRASVIAPLLISTMINLLTFDHVAILPYVNGALQNFLLNNEINEEAKKLRLAEVLEYHRVKSGEELRNHFAHTLKIHKRECEENLSDDDEFPDEDDEIFDAMESELEENDLVKVELGELQGESLLAVCYSVSSFHSQSNKVFDKKVVEIPVRRNSESLSRESKPGLNASMITVTSETTFDDSKTETSERKSGTIPVAKAPKKILPLNIDNSDTPKEEEEDAFIAKPKLMRTPPASARDERTREKLTTKRT